MKQPDTNPIRYAIYLRTGTDDRHGSTTDGIDRQRQLCQMYVERCGGRVVGVYTDEGKSGNTVERKGLKSLLTSAWADQFDAIVVVDVSRLGRGKTLQRILRVLRQGSARLELATGADVLSLAEMMTSLLRMYAAMMERA